MLFTGLSIIHYFKETFCKGKALLPLEVFYKNDLIITEREALPGDATTTRNQIFTIESSALVEPYFIKQPKYFTQDRLESILTEARVYSIFSSIEVLEQIVPKLIIFDKLNYLLVTSMIKDMSPLNGDNRLETKAIAEKFGCLLKLFHSNLPKKVIDSNPNYCRYFFLRKPFPLNLSLNELYRLRFSKILGQAKFAEKLYDYYSYLIQVSEKWEQSVLIHGDIKFDNFLIDNNSNIRLVDWEMADIGDPLWDLAGIWAAYVRINSGYTDSIPFLRISLVAYNNSLTYDSIEKLILFTSVQLIQNAYFAFENNTVNNEILNWAYSALETPQSYLKDFYKYGTIIN